MNKEKKVRWLVWLDWSEGRARMRRDEIKEVWEQIYGASKNTVSTVLLLV